MRKSSSASVKVFSLDRDKAVEAVRTAMQAVKQRCPEIDRVILFGSLARGNAVPGSDADVLVVLHHTDSPYHERFVRYMPHGVAMDVDVFAYTHSELEEMRRSGNRFAARALQDGIDLL